MEQVQKEEHNRSEVGLTWDRARLARPWQISGQKETRPRHAAHGPAFSAQGQFLVPAHIKATFGHQHVGVTVRAVTGQSRGTALGTAALQTPRFLLGSGGVPWPGAVWQVGGGDRGGERGVSLQLRTLRPKPNGFSGQTWSTWPECRLLSQMRGVTSSTLRLAQCQATTQITHQPGHSTLGASLAQTQGSHGSTEPGDAVAGPAQSRSLLSRSPACLAPA